MYWSIHSGRIRLCLPSGQSASLIIVCAAPTPGTAISARDAHFHCLVSLAAGLADDGRGDGREWRSVVPIAERQADRRGTKADQAVHSRSRVNRPFERC